MSSESRRYMSDMQRKDLDIYFSKVKQMDMEYDINALVQFMETSPRMRSAEIMRSPAFLNLKRHCDG